MPTPARFLSLQDNVLAETLKGRNLVTELLPSTKGAFHLFADDDEEVQITRKTIASELIYVMRMRQVGGEAQAWPCSGTSRAWDGVRCLQCVACAGAGATLAACYGMDKTLKGQPKTPSRGCTRLHGSGHEALVK